MINKKLNILVLVLMLASILNASDKILYKKDTIIEGVNIGFAVVSNNRDNGILRLILKLTPTNEIIKKEYIQNKTKIMFEKLEAVQLKCSNGKILYPNDYIYEEFHESYHLIYNVVQINFDHITQINLKDNLFTKSNLIQLL